MDQSLIWTIEIDNQYNQHGDCDTHNHVGHKSVRPGYANVVSGKLPWQQSLPLSA
jgi:hypothetical protein